MDLQTMIEFLLGQPPDQRAGLINAALMGFDALMGVEFTHVDTDCVRARLAVDERHVQPYSLVHGGVYCTLAESTCSVGAALAIAAAGKKALGLENTTRFLRATRPGAVLSVEATPCTEAAGGRVVWSAEIRDEEDRICAKGHVTIAVLDGDHRVAGESLDVDVSEVARTWED